MHFCPSVSRNLTTKLFASSYLLQFSSNMFLYKSWRNKLHYLSFVSDWWIFWRMKQWGNIVRWWCRKLSLQLMNTLTVSHIETEWVLNIILASASKSIFYSHTTRYVNIFTITATSNQQCYLTCHPHTRLFSSDDLYTTTETWDANIILLGISLLELTHINKQSEQSKHMIMRLC